MKKLLFILILITAVFAWERDYSFGFHHYAEDIIELSDSTLLFVGTLASIDIVPKFLVMHLESNGDFIWADSLGVPDEDNLGFAAMQNTDSTFLVTGKYFSTGSVLANYTFDREILWMRVDTPLAHIDLFGYGKELELDPYGNIVSNVDYEFSSFDRVTGELLWSRRFENDYNFKTIDMETVHIEPFGFVRTGYYNTDIPSDGPGSMNKVFAAIVYHDTLGDTLWQRTYGNSDWDDFKDIEVIGNPVPGMCPGFIAVGNSSGLFTEPIQPGLIVRTDLDGNIIWLKKILQPEFDSTSGGNMQIYDISWDGRGHYQDNFVLTGHYVNYADNIQQAFLMKISDSSSGNKIWLRTYNEIYDRVSSTRLSLCYDGGYILSGLIGNGPYSSYSGRLWFCRVDSLGFPMPYYSVQESPEISQPKSLSANAYPNPFNSAVDITVVGYDGRDGITVSIYDLTGNLITTLDNEGNGNSFRWNGINAKGKACPSGAYLYHVDYDNETVTGKMLYLK